MIRQGPSRIQSVAAFARMRVNGASSLPAFLQMRLLKEPTPFSPNALAFLGILYVLPMEGEVCACLRITLGLHIANLQFAISRLACAHKYGDGGRIGGADLTDMCNFVMLNDLQKLLGFFLIVPQSQERPIVFPNYPAQTEALKTQAFRVA